MRRLALIASVVWLISSCQSNDLLLPSEAPKRQRSLSERILEKALFNPDTDPGAQADIALALGEVAIPGQVPRLRMVVAGNYPVLAKGAAKALVRVRLLREPQRREAILQECVKTETNQYVKDQCAAEAAAKKDGAKAVTTLRQIVTLMESADAETRRSGLRQLLTSPGLDSSADDGLESALYHCLQDTDGRVRLLTSAVFLRRSLRADPFATERGD